MCKIKFILKFQSRAQLSNKSRSEKFLHLPNRKGQRKVIFIRQDINYVISSLLPWEIEQKILKVPFRKLKPSEAQMNNLFEASKCKNRMQPKIPSEHKSTSNVINNRNFV
ncbi:unnamed protein product [Hymenolepis diminuta]|uniref:Uncharacterized protein n=1 Tax=Hymenolepis diminuta TaxID=6216 RepID=A0A564Y2F9_HYMDI|nr:unnamed protein product [Hymenolepis diminuta]